MRFRCVALFLCLTLGCRGLTRQREGGEIGEPIKPSEAVAQARFEETPTPVTSPMMDDSLGLAALCIEKGDSTGAAEHLGKHLQAHPEQIMVRAYLAEILLKTKKLPEAQHQFERFIAEAQDSNGPARKQALHCHTRLMEIAQDRDDSYAEHLHRGIGMVLLARQLEGNIDREDVEPGFRERLLCKAVAELNKAKKLRPDEPRPHCYLVEAFKKLDQPRSAEKAAQTAKSLSALLPLAPAEMHSLHMP